MIITKVRDDIVKNRPEEQRKIAKETIRECFEMGDGVYQIEDDREIYPSKERMIMRLRSATRFYSKDGVVIRVATRNKKEKVLVIVENVKNEPTVVSSFTVAHACKLRNHIYTEEVNKGGAK